MPKAQLCGFVSLSHPICPSPCVCVIAGPAAFRGTTGDCEPRSLSGNHREVHLPAQVQEGEVVETGARDCAHVRLLVYMIRPDVVDAIKIVVGVCCS